MNKYRLSEEEIDNILLGASGGDDVIEGYRIAENKLVPLLEEKDVLLKECRSFLLKTIGGAYTYLECRGLITKLNNRLK